VAAFPGSETGSRPASRLYARNEPAPRREAGGRRRPTVFQLSNRRPGLRRERGDSEAKDLSRRGADIAGLPGASGEPGT